jgi:hypothetical protein
MIEHILAIIYLFPWYVALDLIPWALLTILKHRFEKHFIFDNFSGNKYVDTILHSIEEEIIFRYFPYAYFGLPGVVVGSIIWGILHIYNRGITKQEKLLYLVYYISVSIFFIYAFIVDIFAPLFYHVLHNVMIDYMERKWLKKIEKSVKKSKYIKTTSEKISSSLPIPIGQTGEMKPVKVKIPMTLKYVKTTQEYTFYEPKEPIRFKYVKVKV